MIKYVAGFLFDDKGSSVALVLKRKGPPLLVGLWNAIGGKLEEDESSYTAMVREFREETGVSLPWTYFFTLKEKDFHVEFFHAFSSRALAQVKTCEEEIIHVFPVSDLPHVAPDVQWLLPIALKDQGKQF